MRIKVSREALLKPLAWLSSVAGKKHQNPILSHILCQAEEGRLILCASDGEVEMVSYCQPVSVIEPGQITLPAKKVFDICRGLPEDSHISLKLVDSRVHMQSGRSRFILHPMLAEDFPKFSNQSDDGETWHGSAKTLKDLISASAFAMAQQDVRVFLNGLLFRFSDGTLTAAATNGHRLAVSNAFLPAINKKNVDILLPRKAVMELKRILDDHEDEPITILHHKGYCSFSGDRFAFVTQLLEGAFPDYERAFPKKVSRQVTVERDMLKQALTRTAILSNEKNRYVRFLWSRDSMRIIAANPELEQAEEQLLVDYQQEDIEIGFNVDYVLDVLSVMPDGGVFIEFNQAHEAVLLRSAVDYDGIQGKYIIMPLSL